MENAPRRFSSLYCIESWRWLLRRLDEALRRDDLAMHDQLIVSLGPGDAIDGTTRIGGMERARDDGFVRQFFRHQKALGRDHLGLLQIIHADLGAIFAIDRAAWIVGIEGWHHRHSPAGGNRGIVRATLSTSGDKNEQDAQNKVAWQGHVALSEWTSGGTANGQEYRARR